MMTTLTFIKLKLITIKHTKTQAKTAFMKSIRPYIRNQPPREVPGDPWVETEQRRA